MNVSRREAFQLGVLAGAGAALAGCTGKLRELAGDPRPASITLPEGNPAPELRLANRLGFGPRPGQLSQIRSRGIAQTIQDELNADTDESAALNLRLARMDIHRMKPYDLRDLPENEVVNQLQQAALLRAVYGRHSLRERMADFWSNHFNIYARKGLAAYRKGGDDALVVRKHALGNFREMLLASAQSTAMLNYLDNQLNESTAPNENYARELMELHTLGVYGGYTQHDVKEVARCFTGWSEERRFLRNRGTFRFIEENHDQGAKTVLGHTLPPGGGIQDGMKVLDLLVQHPSTGRYLATKLCQYFLGTVPDGVVEQAAKAFQESNGEIKALLQPILNASELLDGPPILKRPFDFVVSALRALDADTDGRRPVQDHLARMGQPLFEWPMPDGYPVKNEAWTGTLLARWNFALALGKGQIGGTSADLGGLVKQTKLEPGPSMMELVAVMPSPALQQKLQNAPDSDLTYAAALCLCSPEFQWR